MLQEWIDFLPTMGLAFALMALFIYFSFKTWIVWWHERHEDEKWDNRLRELLDDLPPLSNGRRPK